MTKDELKRQIEQAAGKVTKLRDELAKAEETYWALRGQLAEMERGIKVGDRVTWASSGGPRFGYVSSIDMLPGGTALCNVRLEKKDGSLARTVVTVDSVVIETKEAP